MHTIVGAACLTLALCAAGPAVAQIYKCPDAQGGTVIQQTPCAGSAGQTLDIRPASGASTPSSANDAQARLAKLKASNAMAEAIRKGIPRIGMDAKQLQQAMGTPSTVNASNISGIRKDQLVYYRQDATWYVYTINDVVDSIQRSDPEPRMARQPVARDCPSSLTIRNAEVSASSGTLSAEERRARWREIETMRNCARQ